jgi:hypothetical protein
MTQTLQGILVALAAGIVSCSAGACQKFPLIVPAKFETLAERQPTLVWQGETGARYRVQIAVLLPEARVALSLDTEVTGNRLVLPAPLPLEHAAVKVLVSSGCEGLDTQDLNAQAAWFFVDVRGVCAMDQAGLKQTPAGLGWSGVRGAARYSLRLYEAVGGRDESLNLLRHVELNEPRWLFPAELAQSMGPHARRVVAVQAICNGQPGRPVSLLLQ